MNGFTAPIYCRSPRSPTCYKFMLILHGIAGVVLLCLSLFSVVALVGLLTLAISVGITRSSYQDTQAEIRSALLSASGNWLLLSRSRGPVVAQISGSPFFIPTLIIVPLTELSGRKWLLVFCTDNIDRETRRRLYVRLRFRHSPSG